MAKDKKSKKDKKGKGKGKDKKPNKKKGTAGQRVLSGSLALTKMKHVRLKMKGKKGKKIDMIAFPVDANFFVKGKDKALYMPIRVIAKDEEDEYGQHGFVSQSVDSKAWKDADEELQEEMRKLPILGSLKDFSFEGGKSDNSGSMSDDEFDPESDDLPF